MQIANTEQPYNSEIYSSTATSHNRNEFQDFLWLSIKNFRVITD